MRKRQRKGRQNEGAREVEYGKKNRKRKERRGSGVRDTRAQLCAYTRARVNVHAYVSTAASMYDA